MNSPANSPPSIPVDSTSFSLAIRDVIAPAPVGSPVDFGRAADALAAAAAALVAAADALRGQQAAAPSFSLVRPPPVSLFDSLNVRDVINEFLVSKARSGRSERYLRQLRVSLSSFSKGRSLLPMTSITVSDVERWIFGQDWKPKTMKGYLSDLHTLFAFALRRGYVRDLSACQVELPDVPSTEAPGIHTPAEVATVLETARLSDLGVMRHLAIRYFAGIRSAEAHRMGEDSILSDRCYIEVHARKSKTRQRRLVKIQPALAAWLAVGGELRPMSEVTVRKTVKLSGVPWTHNATRHSFVTYHLAMWENAGKTALEAGHAEQILFNNYRAVVTQAQAEEFWRIRPA